MHIPAVTRRAILTFRWQSDNDPDFLIVTETATAQVQVNHIVTVEAVCDGDETSPVGGGYKVMPKDTKIGYVVRAKVLNDGPVFFSGTAENSIPHAWTVTVINGGSQAATVIATPPASNPTGIRMVERKAAPPVPLRGNYTSGTRLIESFDRSPHRGQTISTVRGSRPWSRST